MNDEVKVLPSVSGEKKLRGASDTDDMVTVDSRNRISLGAHARHDRYLITDQGDGQLLLTPVIILAADSPLAKELIEGITSARVRRERKS